MRDAEGTIVCPLDVKNCRKLFLISADVIYRKIFLRRLLRVNGNAPHNCRAANFRNIVRLLEPLYDGFRHFVCSYGSFPESDVPGADSSAYGIAHGAFYL